MCMSKFFFQYVLQRRTCKPLFRSERRCSNLQKNFNLITKKKPNYTCWQTLHSKITRQGWLLQEVVSKHCTAGLLLKNCLIPIRPPGHSPPPPPAGSDMKATIHCPSEGGDTRPYRSTLALKARHRCRRLRPLLD